jgi:hypothetical protein
MGQVKYLMNWAEQLKPQTWGRPGKAWSLFFLLFGPFLILVGFFLISVYGRMHILTCSHAGDSNLTCTQQVSWFGWVPLNTAETLNAVSAAELETNCYTDGESSQYKCEDNAVMLVTASGPVSISSDYFNTITAAETMENINRYIQGPGDQILVVRSINGLLAGLGMGFVAFPPVLLGLIILFVSFNKAPS